MSVDALVEEFARRVAMQNDAILKGDATTGNKCAKQYVAAFTQLRTFGDEGRNALAALLTDDRAEVTVMAAAFLLRHCGERARTVLEAEAERGGPVGFGAAQALQRWKEGTWALDPA